MYQLEYMPSGASRFSGEDFAESACDPRPKMMRGPPDRGGAVVAVAVAGTRVAVAAGGTGVDVDVGATTTFVGVALAAGPGVFVAVAFGADVGVSVAEMTIGVDFLPLPCPAAFGPLPPEASDGAACVASAKNMIAAAMPTSVTPAVTFFREYHFRSLTPRANKSHPHLSPEGQHRQPDGPL